MRRSSIFLLLGAVLLGVLAVIAARGLMGNAQAAKASEAPKVYVVVAAQPVKFGEKLAPNMLKAIAWPGALPTGGFTTIRDVVGDGERTTLKEIKEGEVVLDTALSGGAGRLASSNLLGPDMRAVAVEVNEASGAGGFLAPGDRVDVFMTREFGEEAAYAGVVLQGARVLAVGQTSDPSTSEPNVVKSATIEVTPAEAQRIALAQAVGQVFVALRPTGDESRVPMGTVSAFEMFGMRPPQRNGEATQASAPSGHAPRAAEGGRNEVRIVRGTETSSYRVP